MPVYNRDAVMHTANQIELRIHHFARGTYPEADGSTAALPLNRFFLPIANPHGEACYIADTEKRFPLRPGCAYFIPLHHPAAVRLDRELTFLSIQFTCELYAGVDIFSNLHASMEIDDAGWLRRAEAAFAESNGYAAAAELQAVVRDFTGLLFRRMEPEAFAAVTRFAEFQPELNYIRTHCLATTTVEEVAALRGRRREVFSRNFSRLTGVTPKEFLTRSLVKRACRLLQNSDRLSREVAFELNFTNEFYFSRFFKKHVGISPRRFQQQYIARNSIDDFEVGGSEFQL